MVKKTKGKHRLDKFYHLAKEQGYRSRAAFKLIQLNRKYDFLSGARNLLDLCAAPGGWCQVAVKNMPVGSQILGVDLAPIKPIRGVKTFIGDITTQKCRQAIRKESGGQLMDVVLHDGAPNVGGAWSSEAYGQSWLVLESLRMATDVLAPGGIFVTKIFRSKDYSALLYAFNQLFNKVEATKPAASRNASAEIFVVCQGYKAPAKIDPRLLDPKHLFQDVAEPPKNAGPDALLKAKVKQRRFREGYEEGLSTSRKVVSAAAFVHGDNPVEMLGQYTSLALDGDEAQAVELEGVDDLAAMAEMVRSHPATTSEIRILCGDLQVLGRSEFKQLLKWRLTLKKDFKKISAAAAAADKKKKKSKKAGDGSSSEDEDDEEQEVDEDGLPVEKKDKATLLEEQLLEEMAEIKDRMDRRKKREKRRRRELKIKSRVRAAQLAQSEGIGEEDNAGPDGLFSLASLKTRKGGVDGVADAAAPSDEDAALSSEESEESSESEIDSDEERLRYDATMDEYLEESYRSWKVRQRMKGAGGGVEKKRRRRLGMDGELDDEEDEFDSEKGSEDEVDSEEEEEEDEEMEEEEGGGLIVSLDQRRVGRAAGAAAAASQWFSQELFDDADLEDDDEEEGLPPAKRRAAAAAVKPTTRGAAAAAESDSEEDGEAEEESEDDEEDPSNKGKNKVGKANGYGFSAADRVIPDSGTTAAAASAAAAKRERAGFEEVPMSDSDDGSDSGAEEFEALDDDQKAEVRALAKKFLRRKSKEDIMEAAYNRYAFHDTNLPKWFVEDENKYMRPAPQLTAEEYKAAKEELRAIDARPIRKVVEAKARKRKRMQAKLTQARQKAESIANQEDVPMKAKMREIEKLYAKARASGGNKKKSGGGSRSDQYKKKKGPPLDARMRKDKRGMDAAVRRNKAKGRAPPRGAPAGKGGKGGKKGGRR